jgi:NAD(P)-dependent dehydrogenase (short-subunit alcohol dehydrogenase family)
MGGGKVKIQDQVAVVTGAGSGIGRAVAGELARRGASAIALVDRSDVVQEIAAELSAGNGSAPQAVPFVGDVTDSVFRANVFERMVADHGLPRLCVPAAGITRDALTVKINKESGRAEFYCVDDFRLTVEVNLIAAVYWALEFVGRIAEHRYASGLKRWNPSEETRGAIVFIGSVSSQGNKGQIAYAATKAGLEGAAATLTKEAMFHGVRCGVIHPGFTDTPMVRALGEDYISDNILPYTQLRRLIKPEEIADAICFLLSNSAVSGELWADAGWHPSA